MRKFGFFIIALSLSGCGLLAPRLDVAKLTPTATPTLEAYDLAFISPTDVGSWVVVTPTTPVPLTSAWYEAMGFEGLPPLMQRMLKNNPTLAQAQARLKQAEAQSSLSLSAVLPGFISTASASRGRNASNSGFTNPPTENRQNIGTVLTVPLDFFGRLTGQTVASRRLRDSADASVVATRLQLEKAVAQTYIALIAATESHTLWQQALPQAEELNRLTQLRYAAGDLPMTAAQPVFAALQTQRSQALAAERQKTELSTALSTLLGESPQAFIIPEADKTALQREALALPSSISSTALLQRPDVRAAATQMAATNASIGAARAAFLPSVTLNANAGFSADGKANLWEWSNRAWSVGPVVNLPLFQGQALRANLKRSWGYYEEAVGVYKGQVLNAYGEVTDALTAQAATRAQAQSMTAAAHSLGRVESAMKLRYTTGDVAKTDWLNASLNALQAQSTALQANAASHAASAGLVTALGGSY